MLDNLLKNNFSLFFFSIYKKYIMYNNYIITILLHNNYIICDTLFLVYYDLIKSASCIFFFTWKFWHIFYLKVLVYFITQDELLIKGFFNLHNQKWFIDHNIKIE